ncbi:MAG: CAP domain-containing protein [Flavobacterium sp.]
MKTKHCFFALLFIGLLLFSSCSNETEEVNLPETQTSIVDKSVYVYNTTEVETMTLINDYRKSIGLNALEKLNFISLKSEGHANYMIANNVVNHNDFVARSSEIIRVLGAKNVSENIAYNYISPTGALDAWLKSSSHKENIVGNFTHFGISIKQDPLTGKKYYVNIFARI